MEYFDEVYEGLVLTNKHGARVLMTIRDKGHNCTVEYFKYLKSKYKKPKN